VCGSSRMISTAILGPAKLQHHAGVFSMETRQYSPNHNG
jgi:hypothetical protein